ncbi:MAG: ELWxxDGT repeat protein, partial [Thermoanaerobaculia bacterium]
GSLLLFWANDGVHGAELWKTNGTVAGTGLVEDLAPGADGAMPLPQDAKASPAVGGRLLFWVEDGSAPGYQLWASDGTPSGTAWIEDVMGSGSEFSSTTLGGAVFFRAHEPGQGGGLWKSDGTGSGTVLVKETTDLHELTVAGEQVFFRLDGGFSATGEIWASDGTEAGTGPVPLPPGVAVLNGFSGLLALGDKLLFYGYSSAFDLEPWITDGTEAGTIPLGDLHPGEDSSFTGERGIAVGGLALFRADNPDGVELWKSDGTPAGTQLLKRIDQSDASGVEPEIASFPWFPTLPAKADLAGTLLFAADDGSAGRELWRSDGTEAGTSLLKDLHPSGNGFARQLTPFGGKVFLVGDPASLWSSDGTGAGTTAFPSGCDQSLTPAGGQLFCILSFISDDLRKIGPSDADTTLVKSIHPGLVGDLTAAGSRLFFAAQQDGGRELWTSDGTEAGTQRVADIAPGPASSLPQDLTAHLGTVFFSADDGSTGRELWKSDGTAAGTVRVRDILPGPGSSDPRGITSAGGLVFFIADDGSSGAELWRSDGTAAGTFRVKDIRPGPQSSSIQGLTAYGDIVVFAADDGVNGQELWASYGSADAAFMVKDIRPGAGSSYPGAFRVAGHAVLFAADDGTHGLEPWRTDGFEAGTFLVHDVFTGPEPSSPTGFLLSGSYLYFTANDGTRGFELWALDRAALGTTLAATKRVMSPTYPGSTVTYEIVITNTGAGPHPDNPGDEMGDMLPAGLTLTGASADVGTVTLDLPNNRVMWNGALDPGESATVLVHATLSPSALEYSMFFNQAGVSYDSDGDGTHDKLRPSSDPGRGPEEPTLATVSTPPLDFYTVTPCRVLDTRTSSPLAAGVKETFAIAGSC